MTSNSSANKPLRAFLDVSDLPSSIYGGGQARLTRRLVHLMLAKHADPDGTAIYPSKQRLAEECAGISEYTLGEIIKWLIKHRLVRRLPDLHRQLGTIQYELLRPEAGEVAQGKQDAADRVVCRREATRKRTEKWRARKKKPDAVTQTVSVTSDSGDANCSRTVTQPCDAVTQPCDAVTQPCDACDAENPALSPSTVLYNRPYEPSVRPSNLPSANSDGGSDGALTSHKQILRATEQAAEAWAQWISDLWMARYEVRYIPGKDDISRIGRILSDHSPELLAVTTYRFCGRPKGLGGLSDAFGAFWREWTSHSRDAGTLLDDPDSGPLPEILSDLHSGLFQYESLILERGVTKPESAVCREDLYSLLGLEVHSEESRASVSTENVLQ